MTPAALRKELVGSGYYREATRKGKADEDEAGADDDSAGEPGDDNEDEESEEE
jgi:hypothetical protein